MDSDSVGLLETVLADEHRAAGARMVPFAGWNMPVQYTDGILAEHHYTREHVSLFDICHMGEFRVTGDFTPTKLDAALARPVADQQEGTCRYNFLLNEKGGVLDDLIVYRLGAGEFYIVVNAATRVHDAEILKQRLGNSVNFVDESECTAKLDLQGPAAAEVLIRLGIPRETLPGYYRFVPSEIHGVPCLLSRTGYTGELGYEIYIPAGKAVSVWRFLLSDPAVKPAGLGARDTLRLEMGYPLYGHEMDPETTPVEAGFGAMLKLDTNPREFVGSAALRSQKPVKRLYGLQLAGRRAARAGASVFLHGECVGRVTSGVFSPSLGCAIALAYLPTDLTISVGDSLDVELMRGMERATVIDLPFYKKGTARQKN